MDISRHFTMSKFTAELAEMANESLLANVDVDCFPEPIHQPSDYVKICYLSISFFIGAMLNIAANERLRLVAHKSVTKTGQLRIFRLFLLITN